MDQLHIIFECINNLCVSEGQSWKFIGIIPFVCKTGLLIYNKYVNKFLTIRAISIPNAPSKTYRVKLYPNNALPDNYIPKSLIVSQRIVTIKEKQFLIMDDYYIDHNARIIKLFWTTIRQTHLVSYAILKENNIINKPYRIIDYYGLLEKYGDRLIIPEYYSMITENYYYEFSGRALERFKIEEPKEYKYYGVINSINKLDDFQKTVTRIDNNIKALKNTQLSVTTNNPIDTDPKYKNHNRFHFLRDIQQNEIK